MSQPLRDQIQTTLGDNYTLEQELGGGGMSHVFVAQEKSLGRRIVVKVLPVDTSAQVSIDRFKREIQVAARLQHPHIVPLLSAGEINALPFYTMPFVKGESLRARLARSGELSVNEAVHIMRDVAAALAYAHSEGVVHRDIKPDNVIVSGGVAVVTDFGVAKAVDVAATEGHIDPTGITSIGVALGTPAYMAPEQASADPHVDHRADIYSFGCLAYELLAGSSPFAGRAPQQMLAAHVTEQPESLLKRRPGLPPALAALVMKCLEKRAGDRPQSADELLSALDAIATPSGGMAPTAERLKAQPRPRTKWIIPAAVAVLLVAIIGAFIWKRANALTPYTIGATNQIAVSPDLEFEPAISPDGKLVAYAATTPAGDRIFVRQIDGSHANLLTGELDGDHGWPRWSPDGTRISFAAKGGIYVIPALTGGAPKRIVESATTHSWSYDGMQIVYEGGWNGGAIRSRPTVEASGIWMQSMAGGAPRRIRAAGYVHSPALSPDGRLVAYVEGRRPTLSNVSTNSVWVMNVAGGEPFRISDSISVNLSPVFAPDGRSILYVSNRGGARDVYQQQITKDGHAVGNPVRLTTSLSPYTITLSSDGSRLAYDVVKNFSNIFQVPVGATPAKISDGTQITRENQHIEALSVSHDGKWIAYDSDRGGNFDIYKVRVDGGDPVQLTTSPGNDFEPSWSPDDSHVAFHSNRNGNRDIYLISSEGGGEEQATSGPEQDYFPRWSPDGTRIVFWRETEKGYVYLVIVRSRDGRWSKPLTLGNVDSGRNADEAWALDGSRIFCLLRTGIFSVTPDGHDQREIVNDNQLHGRPLALRMSPRGNELFVFVAGDDGLGHILAIPLGGGTPRIILSAEPNASFGRWPFATDGTRLFYTRAAWESDVWEMDLKH